ncbi:little elongation complex subunit 1 [Amblyraja radiata]|uniref:little elongation complex subunit 1 n=1 Tax=Amblyraja radiata TaxID=386614 RepID=UPI0014030ADE|nr:little elongation complex subunit 1 [Amblyraja radiata]
MDAMRVELEEKRSSIKMYQQTHLEFSKLEQEQIKNDALKKKLETQIKKLEETTTKQKGEIKQLKKEKTTLERNLKKTQEKLLVRQKNGVKVLKDADSENSRQEVPRVDKNKVKLLLDEIWMCIERSSVQEKPSMEAMYSPDTKPKSWKKCKILNRNGINPHHSSPLKEPSSSSLQKLKCDQENNNQSELDTCLIDEGLKNNGDSTFCDEKTVEVMRHQDPVDSSSTDTDSDNENDAEQDALSLQLQEILFWTQPLPPQLSPLPYSTSSGKQSIFGNITDSSDDEGAAPRRICSEGFSEAEHPDSPACSEAVTTDQSSLTEAGVSESTPEESSAEKMDCTKTETENVNIEGLTDTKTEDEVSYPSLIAGDAQCRSENNTEAQSSLEETQMNSVMTTSEIQCVHTLLTLNGFREEDMTSPLHNYPEGLQENDDSKNTAVLVTPNSKIVELTSSNPNSKNEVRIDAHIKEGDTEDLILQETDSCRQLVTTSEEMEVEEIHYKTSTCDSQKNECINASVLVSDNEHTKSMDVAKGPTDVDMMEVVISHSQLNSTVVNGVSQEQCIPAKDMEMEEVNCSSFASDELHAECTQTSLQTVDVEFPQGESPLKEQTPKMTDTPPKAEETGVSQGNFKTLISTELTMEENNSADSISPNEKDKSPLNSPLASDVEETFNKFEVKEQSKLKKMKEIVLPGHLDCSTETDQSLDESNKYVSVENKGKENINYVNLISNNLKNKSIVTSTLHNATGAEEQNRHDRMKGTTVLVTIESSNTEGGSKGSVCARDVLGPTYFKDELAVSSEQGFIQQKRSDSIKETSSSVDMASPDFDGPQVTDVIQNSSKYDVHIRDMELDSIESGCDRPKDECIAALVPFNSQVKSAIIDQDSFGQAEENSPHVKSDSSVSLGVILGEEECISTEEKEEETLKISTPSQCALISIQSCNVESQRNSTIKDEDIITKTKEASIFLNTVTIEVPNTSVETELAQDNSRECTSTKEMPNEHENKDKLCVHFKSFEVTECESQADKQKDQLMENNEMERSEMGEVNHTLKPSGDYLSSGQTSPHFDAFSDESSKPNVAQNIAEQCPARFGQVEAADTSNNTALEFEEYSSIEKSKDEPLGKALIGNGIQQPVLKSCSPSKRISQMNQGPQTHEMGVSTLVRKIKKRKQWKAIKKSPRSIEDTQKTIHHELDDKDMTTEIATPENRVLEVQAQNCKTEVGQHGLSKHITLRGIDFPFDSESASASNETDCNNKSTTNVAEESTASHPDCNESKTKQLTLDKGLSQGPCQTPTFNMHNNTNVNYEAAGNGDNAMSVECADSDLDNPAQKVCDNETYLETSPKSDFLGCTPIENEHLEGNASNRDYPVDVEISESSSEVCSYQDTSICTKENLGIEINSKSIGITEEMANFKASMNKVNSSTNNTITEASNYMPPVQKVDIATQTELICNGSQVVLFTRNSLNTLSQICFKKEDKDKFALANNVSSLPDATSGHLRPIRSASVHEKEALFESTIDGTVNLKSFRTSVGNQTCKTASGRKGHSNKILPNALIDGDAQQDAGLQKSEIRSTYKRHAALRRKSKGLDPNNLPVVNTEVSTPVFCMQEIHQVMLEMGQPLPPLLPPLVATPPRTIRSTRVQSPRLASSNASSLCSPEDDFVSPSKEISKTASISPLLDHLQQKSPPTHSPSPLELARNERIQSSPLQFCTTTPKHAVPVPGRLPKTASASAGSALPQENSVKILDAMYPNLSARARTLNILRGNVQLSMRGSAGGENQAGPMNQIMGFKAINSTPTAFVKAGSNSRSEGCVKELEQQKPINVSMSGAVEKSRQDQKATKRCAENDVASRAKKVKTEGNCQHEDYTSDLIAPKESSTVDGVQQTKPLCNRAEPKTTNTTEVFSQPCEPVNASEEAVASALKKITESCFDLLPVIRSHVFVGNIPQLPVLRDEEKEVIYELSGNKDLIEALLLAIIKKLKVEQTALDGNDLQALSRVYVAICRHQGDLERARLLSYSILKEDFPDSSKLLLIILSVWQNIFSMQGPVNKAMQAVAKQRAKGDVLDCLSAYLNWEKNPPLDISSLVSSFLVAMQQSPKVRFQTSNEYGMDFNGDMWELISAIDLLCSQQQWTWTHDCFIRKEVWPVMDKWMKRRKGHRNVLHIQDVTVAGVMRLIGCLGQQGLKKSSTMAVQNIAAVINKFLQQAFQEGVPWPVQLSAAYAVYDLAPSNPNGALESLQKWKASVTEPIPPVASKCLMELETLCERLNFESQNL